MTRTKNRLIPDGRTTRIRQTALAVAVSMFMGSTAMAQSADGTIFGQTKSGATVSILNLETGTSRQLQAEASGSFAFSKLPPGRYRVTTGGVTREVSVSIGTGTEVKFEDNTQLERIEVSGSRQRSIDVSSVETSTVFSSKDIQALPVARDVNAVALLAPGVVKGDPDLGDGGGLPSFGGASVAENGYYINGFDVTNIRNFLSYANLPFDAIEQQQIKTGGYGAEYGRSLGGVISLVTKRGTNEWKGGASVYWEPSGLRSKGKNVRNLEPEENENFPSYKVLERDDKRDDLNYNLYGGGPIIKDKLFVFGLVEGRKNTIDDFKQDGSTHISSARPNGLLKVDFTPTDSHSFELTALTNRKVEKIKDYEVADFANKNPSKHIGPAALSERKSGGDVITAKYTGYLTDNLTVSALVGRVNHTQPVTTGARLNGQDCPVVLDTDLSEIGCWAKPFPGLPVRDSNAPAEDKDKRRASRFDLEYTIAGHTIRAGYDGQKFTSSEAGGSTFSGGYYYRYYISPNGTVNGVANAVAPGAQYVRQRKIVSTTGEYDVENTAMYVEDTWKVDRNVVLYGGIRSESFNNKNGDGTSFVKADNLLAPRLGVSWNVKGDSSLKLFANAGRYYIPVASNTNIRATRGEIFETRYFAFNSRDPRTQGPIGLSTEIGVPQINGDGKLPEPATIADTKLKPMSQDELILGFQQAITKEWNVGAKFTHRKINDGMDDFCGHYAMANWAADNGHKDFDSSTLASCMLLNPGNDVNMKIDLKADGNLVDVTIPAKYFGLEKYKRTYNAFEFSLERPFDGKWGMLASYVWSKSRGTAEGYVQSNLNQEDAGATQDFDYGSFTDGSNGYLPNDRRHVFKLYGNYALTDNWRVGLNMVLASGRPKSCIGFVPETVPDFDESSTYTSASSYYCLNDKGITELTQRGSKGRTPWSNTLDLQIAYTPKIASGRMTLQADIFNIFNSQKIVETQEVRDFSRAGSNAQPGQLGLNYGQPTAFQTPRSVRLTARYEF